MKSEDLRAFAEECKKLYPDRYNQLELLYHDPVLVATKMIDLYPGDMGKMDSFIKRLYDNNPQYVEDARKFVAEQFAKK